MTLRRVALVAALALSAAALAAADTGTPVTALPEIAPRALAFKVSPVAHSGNARLADLVKGPLPAVLAGLVVKSGLSPGVDVGVDARLMALKLRQVGLPGWRVDPQGPSSVLLKVPALNLPGAAIRRFAQEYLEKQLSGTAGATIEQRGPVTDLRLFDAQPRLRVSLPDGVSLRGDVVLRVDVLQTGGDGEERVTASVPVGFLVRRYETHLVSTQTIHRGDPLGPQNLVAVQADATYDQDGVPSLDQVAGKVARTFVPAGRVLSRSMVDEPLAIQMGDIVRLLVRSGGVQVDASAKALRDARVGETLPLQVVGTNHDLQGRCVAPGVAVSDAP